VGDEEFTWIIAGVGNRCGWDVLLFRIRPEYATGYDGVEAMPTKPLAGARKRNELRAKVGAFAGAIKEGVGRLQATHQMAGDGRGGSSSSNVKDAQPPDSSAMQ